MDNVVRTSEMKPVIHGKWVKEQDRDNHWHCDNCGFVENMRCHFENYCPNCGAMMDLEANNDT